jgi:uncharacterized protein YjbJ (UPF0337 family)
LLEIEDIAVKARCSFKMCQLRRTIRGNRAVRLCRASDAGVTLKSVFATIQARHGVQRRRRSRVMAGKADQMKGKAKEAVGDLTGNKDLKSEGKADRRAGEVKEKVGHVKDKVEEVIENVGHKVEEVVDKAKDSSHRK